MTFHLLFSRPTIQSQITAIILFGLIVIVVGGSMLERRVGNDYPTFDVEELADRVFSLSSLLRGATGEERATVLRAAQRAGWEMSIQPRAYAQKFTTTSPKENLFDSIVDFIFSPDGIETPLGGWKTFVGDKRVVAAEIDAQTILVLNGLPDAPFWNEVLGRGPHYLVALITLIVLFSSFAVWAITRPLRKIAATAATADITSGKMVFEERGSVEIVAVARSLNEMSDRIASMIEGRTRMLRGVSHDLRTPLTRLRLKIERMEDRQLRDSLSADISRIDSLLRESLRYLRDDHNREAMETADLASMMQTICNEFADVGHDIRYIGPNRFPTQLRPLAITRAVTNLCENAVRFGCCVEVRLFQLGNSAVITVTDDGPGIPNELRAHVLEPFHKIDASRGTSNGFGLGLSIVVEIVQAHGGTLELLSAVPSGLVAKLDIPLKLSGMEPRADSQKSAK